MLESYRLGPGVGADGFSHPLTSPSYSHSQAIRPGLRLQKPMRRTLNLGSPRTKLITSALALVTWSSSTTPEGTVLTPCIALSSRGHLFHDGLCHTPLPYIVCILFIHMPAPISALSTSTLAALSSPAYKHCFSRTHDFINIITWRISI